ncbi:hypothetical protein [Sphingomonas corticis]|uniref:Uncharacterized protein n=1 Tax=Sphingomonas corticis TaxID=2722791 RepID=A0ABX1CU08_9SPHN|nr:hypothetical protein [Sphingomonas corticis]NJR80438.1 hypothetical protein [Sphingomonas corticis]
MARCTTGGRIVPDAADMAAEIQAETVARGLSRTRVQISAGVAGECSDCGHMMLRLVGGLCAFCRDGRLPPDDWEPPVINLPRPREESVVMPKSVQLPSSAIDAIKAVEKRARGLGTSQGEAAADLIVAGLRTIDSEGVRTPLSDFDVEELLAEVRLRLVTAASPSIVEALTTRAELAERKLAQIQAAFA